MASNRIRKVNIEIARELATYFNESRVSDQILITVTAVETGPDLKEATVWCSVIGSNEQEAQVILDRSRHDAQQYLAAKLNLKFVPKIALRLDHGGEYAAHISAVIRKELHQ